MPSRALSLGEEKEEAGRGGGGFQVGASVRM